MSTSDDDIDPLEPLVRQAVDDADIRMAMVVLLGGALSVILVLEFMLVAGLHIMGVGR